MHKCLFNKIFSIFENKLVHAESDFLKETFFITNRYQNP